MSLTFASLQTEVARRGGIDETDEADTAAAWTRAGLNHISLAGAWTWLKAHFTLPESGSQTAGDYSWALPADCFRVAVKTVRYGGKETFLAYRRIDFIDNYYGPDWKDASADNGTPRLITRVGNELWTAPKPSAAHLTSYPSLMGYYWRREPASGTLYLPDEFREAAVCAALAEGWLQEDDPRAEKQLDRFEKYWCPRMMGATLDVGAGDNVESPGWMDQAYEGSANYGDP